MKIRSSHSGGSGFFDQIPTPVPVPPSPPDLFLLHLIQARLKQHGVVFSCDEAKAKIRSHQHDAALIAIFGRGR